MLRDASLVPLSHQHHNGLALCVLTERSLRANPAPDNVAALARRIAERHAIELKNHFEMEEQILFPALGAGRLLERLRAEHRELDRLAAELEAGPTAVLLEAFTGLLRRHIRTEENDLFEEAQRVLPRAVLDEIGAALAARAVKVCL